MSTRLPALLFVTIVVTATLLGPGLFAVPATAAGAGPPVYVQDGTDDRNATRDSPVTVFLGEEGLNMSVTWNASARPSSTSLPGTLGDKTFTGVAGNADGAVVTSDIESVDVTGSGGFTTGAYSFNGSGGDVHVSVTEPEVTDVTVYRGDGTSGADITGTLIPAGLNATVQAEFNFDEAEWAEVTVTGPNGVDVTPELNASDAIEASGDTLILGFANADLDNGVYTVTVEGADDLDAASESVLFSVVDGQTLLGVEPTTVTRGGTVVASVTGAPGDYATLRIDTEETRDTPTAIGDIRDNASKIFRDTGDVVNGTAGSASEGYVGVVLDLGDSGTAQASIDTTYLDDSTVTLEVVEHLAGITLPSTGNPASHGDFVSDADDSADVSVGERDVRIRAAPSGVLIGEVFDIEGTAPEAETVHAYAKIDQNWEELDDDDGSVATDDVAADGSYAIEVDSGAVINLVDAYRVAVIADRSQTGTLSQSEFSEETTASVTIRVTQPALEGRFHTALGQIATEDATVDASGTALGSDEVLIGMIGSRGTVVTEIVSVEEDGSWSAEDVSVSALHDGPVLAFLLATGPDGVVGDGSLPVVPGAGLSDLVTVIQALPAGKTQGQIAEIAMDETVGDVASDDLFVRGGFVLREGSLSIRSVHAKGHPGVSTIEAGETLVVSGTTNRDPADTTIVIELLDEGSSIVAFAELTEWPMQTGAFEAAVEIGGDVDPGTYELFLADGDHEDSVEVTVVGPGERETEPVPTPTEAVADETPTPRQVTRTVVKTAPPRTVVRNVVKTDASLESTSGQPGFGIVVALLAILAAALLAARRED